MGEFEWSSAVRFDEINVSDHMRQRKRTGAICARKGLKDKLSLKGRQGHRERKPSASIWRREFIGKQVRYCFSSTLSGLTCWPCGYLFSIEHEVRTAKPIAKTKKNTTFLIQLSPFSF